MQTPKTYQKARCFLLGLGKGERLTVNDLRPLNHELAGTSRLSLSVFEGRDRSSTFQLLGFRHVIGTLWGANDAAAAAIAARFYERLLQRPDEPSAVARALHHAAMVEREKSDSFNWVRFIHMGP